MKKSLHIVLVNYNNVKDTMETVECIMANNDADYHIVIVDNASTVGRIGDVKDRFPQVELIMNNCNAGFAVANNIGIDFALRKQADYIMLLNNDTIVPVDFCRKMLEIGEQYHTDVLSCKVTYFSHPNKIWYGGGEFSPVKGYGVHYKDDHLKADVNEVSFITGCCIMARRDIFEKNKLPDDYFMYFEDVDFCLKLKKAGYKLFYTPLVSFKHKVSATSGADSPFFIYYWNRNRQILMKKYRMELGIQFYIGYCKLILSRNVKLLLYLLKRQNKECKAMIKGMIDGMKYKPY